MKKQITRLQQKAERSLQVAEKLFKSEEFDFSVSRAYYAMFYMAEAALLTKGLAFSKHKGVIAGFWKQFIKTGIFDKELHKALHDAFEIRNVGDYAYDIEVTEDEAKMVLKYAKKFCNEVKKYLKSGL